MRVCHVSSAMRILASRSFHLECVSLASAGVDVVYIGPHQRDEVVCGVRLVSAPRRSNRALRILTTPLLLRKLLREKADVYQFHDPELIPVGLVLKRLLKKHVIYDMWEDFPSMMLNKKYLPRYARVLARRLVGWAEDNAARHCDGLVAADPLTLRRLSRTGASRKVVFFNLPNLSYFPGASSAEPEFDFVYRGGLAERTGTPLLLHAISILHERGRFVRVLLLGYADSPAALEALKARVRELPSGCITWMESIPHEAMAATLSSARVGLCPLRPIPKFLLNIPVKVWEYWACGLPVIATNLPPVRPFVREGKNGMLIAPDDATALADAMEWTLDHPEEAREMGMNGRRAVESRLNSAGEVKKLMRLYKSVLEAANA